MLDTNTLPDGAELQSDSANEICDGPWSSIQEKLKKPLAEMVLFGDLAGGGLVRVTVENDELRIDLENELVGA